MKSDPKAPRRTDHGAQSAATAQSDNGSVNTGPLSTLVGHHVRKAHSHYFKTFTEALSELGLAPGQYAALILIGLNPDLSQLALAAAAGIDPTTIVPITERFARDGWVRRLRRPEDRRVYRMRLTPEGEAIMARARPLVEAYERKLTAKLSSAERLRACELLARIAAMEAEPAVSSARKRTAATRPSRGPPEKSTRRSRGKTR